MRLEKFHERLDYLMSEVLNISGNSLAAKLGMNQALVNRYRKGETQPSIEFPQKICIHFGISANWLLLNIGPIKINEIAGSNGAEVGLALRQSMLGDICSLEQAVTSLKLKYAV